MANANKLKMAFGKRLIDCTPSVRDSCDYSRTIPSRWAGVLGKRATPAQVSDLLIITTMHVSKGKRTIGTTVMYRLLTGSHRRDNIDLPLKNPAYILEKVGYACTSSITNRFSLSQK